MAALPESEILYLDQKGWTFEQVSESGHSGLIIRDYPLPSGKYDHDLVSVLILLPPGFPDVPPDMFFLFPWVKLRDGNRHPRAADVPHQFAGVSWQRWSRHSNEWRAGRDGLATFLKRIQHAIDTAVA